MIHKHDIYAEVRYGTLDFYISRIFTNIYLSNLKNAYIWWYVGKKREKAKLWVKT